jgi:1-acyl-sn-glycerol-3-phosphate acyltransferase
MVPFDPYGPFDIFDRILAFETFFMRLLLLPLQRLYFVYAFTIFLLIMLLIFPAAVIASLWGRVKGGNAVYRLCNLWADICFPLIFIFSKRKFEAPHDGDKAYIFVANHQSYGDAAFLARVIRQPLRVLGKAEMAGIPIFGFIYKMAVVAVDRKSIENRAQSIRIIRSLVNKKISVLIFPEGTFNRTGNPLKEFYNGAFRIAIETQTPVKPILFLDTFDRLPYGLWNLNPGKCRAVFLNEIPVAGLTMSDLSSLRQKIFDIMSDKLREYGASWIKS